MNVEVRTWPGYQDALAKLRRKYPRIDADIAQALQGGPVGRMDALPGYSHKLWKYRVASRDMGRGKRGGFRIIFYMHPDQHKEPKVIHLLTIYAKSERADVSHEELLRLWNRFWEYVKSSRAGGRS